MPPLHSQDFVIQLHHHGHHVRSLTLVGQFDFNLVLESCPQLLVLDMTLVRSLNMAVLQRMVECLPRLKVLRLNCCYGQGLAWLRPLMQLRHLQELAFVNDTPEYLDDDIPSNPAGQQLLQDPVADNMDIMDGTDNHLDPFTAEEEDNVGDYIEEDDQIEFLPAPGSYDEDEEESILRPDHLGEFLVARAATLTRLSFEGSDLMGFNLFEAFDRTVGSLAEEQDVASAHNTTIALCQRPLPVLMIKSLNLAKTSIHRTRSVVEPLLKQCPELEILDLSGNFEEPWDRFSWSLLSQRCLRLTSLNLGQLASIDNDRLVQVIIQCPGFCSLIAPQSNLDSKVLDAIVDRWLESQAREGDSAEGATTQQVAPFIELDVSWCSDIEQRALERVLQHLSTLKSVKFSWCQHIDLSIFRSEWSCMDLEELEAQGLDKPAVVDEPGPEESLEHAMFSLMSRLRSLRRLTIGSDEVVVSVAGGLGCLNPGANQGSQLDSGSSKLEYLELVGSEDHPLSEQEMTVIAEALPQLKHFHFGLGLVPLEMQTWLAGRRPDVRQEETRIYY
ncbi:hypothetical protein EDD11_010262 [Mortierella claussenii]|nr:hypothetical protein EDD11_010262 [Mortierella claussenii]